MRTFLTINAAALMVVCGLAGKATAAPIAILVDTAYSTDQAPLPGEYDFASVSVYIDPAVAYWIAWNDAPTVSMNDAGCSAFLGGSAGSCLGPGGFGTNDSISLTVTNPSSQSSTMVLDQNDPWGMSLGTQNVLYGTAGDSPDVFRQSPPWGNPPNQPIIIDEGGAFNGLFTTAGIYQFDFSFVNEFMETAGHPDIYLLVDSWEAEDLEVPEPATLLLFGVGLIGLGSWNRRRTQR